MQKFIKLSSLSLLLIFVSCSSKKIQTKEQLLNCILDRYILEYSISNTEEIFVSEMKGWTDTSSIIRVLSQPIKRIGYEEIFYAEYKGVSIYLEYGQLTEDSIITDFSNPNLLISNSLKWKKLHGKLRSTPPPEITPPEEFNELQLIYNPIEECIEQIIMGKKELRSKIKSTCVTCK